MAWLAFDRAIKSAEIYQLPGPVAHWRELRARIHADVCVRGFDAKRGSFVRAYGSKELDASLLLLPAIGFLPPEDPRIVGTVAAVERELVVDGLVLRYDSARAADGLPPGLSRAVPRQPPQSRNCAVTAYVKSACETSAGARRCLRATRKPQTAPQNSAASTTSGFEPSGGIASSHTVGRCASA